MDPDSEVKKRERLTKCILKLKDNKLAGVWIKSSGSRKPRMLRKSLSLCGPRVEIIGTRDWKSGVLAKDLLCDQETTWRNQMGLLRHNCFDTACPGVYGNREFPGRVHYCGFPIAMKAWMGTSESLPSHLSSETAKAVIEQLELPGVTGKPSRTVMD
ncbi:hypothetical protein F2Q69_00011167 [Brassica cretica]|uniref:Uncharacterized protein n=1 Tax=Brassica cretica TaxID=69181 RepID=A0A8S9QSQ3_BRACR|nr:hypothetical protein F2Q69_00011167 [Brassica cretica]